MVKETGIKEDEIIYSFEDESEDDISSKDGEN